MSETDPYLLGYRREEQERLEQQATQLGPDSARLFDEIGIAAGARVLEVGCGPRGCLALLADRVGDGGKVVGIERSDEQVDRARRFVAQQGLANVEVLCADARHTGLPDASFDLATARLVLVNVPQPEQIVAEMVRLVRPGGVVAMHEADASSQRIDPPLAAQARLLDILDRYAKLNGIDRAIAPRVPRLLRQAGIADIRVNPIVHVYPPDHPRRRTAVEFVENARARILEQKLVEIAELDQLTSALSAHLEDPHTLVVSSLFLQAWGRKKGG